MVSSEPFSLAGCLVHHRRAPTVVVLAGWRHRGSRRRGHPGRPVAEEHLFQLAAVDVHRRMCDRSHTDVETSRQTLLAPGGPGILTTAPRSRCRTPPASDGGTDLPTGRGSVLIRPARIRPGLAHHLADDCRDHPTEIRTQHAALSKLALLDQGASLRSAGGACPRCAAGRAASCAEPP